MLRWMLEKTGVLATLRSDMKQVLHDGLVEENRVDHERRMAFLKKIAKSS